MKGNRVYGVILFLKRSQVIFVRDEPVDQVNLRLNPECKWQLGIDQSTSCTGIALRDLEGQFLILLDIKRDRALAREEYFRELHFFLKRIARGMTFTLVVNERPVPGKYRSSGDVLREFLGHLNEWIISIPELSLARHESIYPQTWKSLIVNKSKGKNRSNIKSEVALDVVDIYPDLQIYYNGYRLTDYDSFDALGILEGFCRYAFDSSGNELIHGSVEKRHVSFVCYKWVSLQDIKDNARQALFGDALSDLELTSLMYNERYDMHTNIRMASSNYDAIVTVIPTKELQPFQWRFGIDITDRQHALVMLVFRKAALRVSECEALNRIFEWKEDVYNE